MRAVIRPKLVRSSTGFLRIAYWKIDGSDGRTHDAQTRAKAMLAAISMGYKSVRVAA